MDIEVDNSGELVFENGDLVLLDADEAIAQSLRISLRMFLGEWFLNTDEGIPYIQSIFTKAPRISIITTVLRRAILAVPGVEEIKTFDVQFNAAARQLSVSFDARITDGGTLTFTDFVVGTS